MRMPSLLMSLFTCACLLACSGNTPSPQADLSVKPTPGVDMAQTTCCGKPGDTGNSIGVGKYCTKIGDCGGKTMLCSNAGNAFKPDRPTFFCTLLCTPASDMGPGTDCGENATCACDSGGLGCACTPTACVNNPPPGCHF